MILTQRSQLSINDQLGQGINSTNTTFLGLWLPSNSFPFISVNCCNLPSLSPTVTPYIFSYSTFLSSSGSTHWSFSSFPSIQSLHGISGDIYPYNMPLLFFRLIHLDGLGSLLPYKHSFSIFLIGLKIMPKDFSVCTPIYYINCVHSQISHFFGIHC